jgi:hypothetical protein
MDFFRSEIHLYTTQYYSLPIRSADMFKLPGNAAEPLLVSWTSSIQYERSGLEFLSVGCLMTDACYFCYELQVTDSINNGLYSIITEVCK